MKSLRFVSAAIIFAAFATVSATEGVWTIYTNTDEVRAIVFEGDHVWCATTGGVLRWNKNDETYEKYTTGNGMGGNWVYSAAVDRNGVKWFGTWDGGVSWMDGKTWNYYNYQTSNGIKAAAVDSNNVKWFKTDAALSSYDGNEWRHISVSPNLSTFTESIAVDSHNVKWFTATGLIRSYDGVTMKVYSKSDGLVAGSAQAVAVDLDDVKWFGTMAGVSRFDGTTWTTYTTADGLAHNTVYSIAVDGTT